jgi:hypothetical protein
MVLPKSYLANAVLGSNYCPSIEKKNIQISRLSVTHSLFVASLPSNFFSLVTYCYIVFLEVLLKPPLVTSFAPLPSECNTTFRCFSPLLLYNKRLFHDLDLWMTADWILYT